ncbi:hypothetical protein O9X98_04610 [Agrobacterium salinitolerans]|nr:hypothetical protein [Agrobacterium salinitolerans]
MMFEYQFVNRIIGVASGFRDVALNHVQDKAVFELLDRSENDFPIATRDRDSVRPTAWRPDYKNTTRWHDDSHWKFVCCFDEFRQYNATEKFAELAPKSMVVAQDSFAVGTEFREVVEDMRPQTMAAIQDHFDTNVAVIGDTIWLRAEEPCYGMRLKDAQSSRKVSGILRASSDTNEGYDGQRFRLDEQEAFREAVLNYMESGWTLENSNGITWGVPDMEILIPESIALEAEAQTIVDLAFTLRNAARTEMNGMSYAELDAICLLKDAFETSAPLATAFDDGTIADLVDPIHLLMRYRRQDELNPASLALATDRWENRAIGDFLAVRSHRPVF